MNNEGLYKVIQEARVLNKSVELLTSDNYNYEFIINPEDTTIFPCENTLRFRDIIVDLTFIIGAIIIDNKENKYHENKTREEMYPLKTEGKVYVGNG